MADSYTRSVDSTKKALGAHRVTPTSLLGADHTAYLGEREQRKC